MCEERNARKTIQKPRINVTQNSSQMKQKCPSEFPIQAHANEGASISPVCESVRQARKLVTTQYRPPSNDLCQWIC